MNENRSQDIQLIKIAIQIEKDGDHFFERFEGRLGESSSLVSFIQQIREETAADLETFENLLVPLESVQNTEKIEDISLDDYVKDLQKTRSEKFYPQAKAEELFGESFNPIHVLAYCKDTLKELSTFVLDITAQFIIPLERENLFIITSFGKCLSSPAGT